MAQVHSTLTFDRSCENRRERIGFEGCRYKLHCEFEIEVLVTHRQWNSRALPLFTKGGTSSRAFKES